MKRSEDQKRNIRASTSRGMRRVAERRKCSECGRKMALSKPFLVDGFWYQVCNYCGYEKTATELS